MTTTIGISELRDLYASPEHGLVGKSRFIQNLDSAGIKYKKTDVDKLFEKASEN